MKAAQKIIVPALWICGIIIFAVSAAGVGQTNLPLFIVILVFSLLMGTLALAKIYMGKGASNYDVEQQQQEGKGQDNQAYEKETGEGKQSGPAGKWTKNYVPFKGFPKGSSKTEDKENGVEVVNEVGGSSGGSTEKKDGSEKSDEKWQKNYVPYQEPEEDSNKQ